MLPTKPTLITAIAVLLTLAAASAHAGSFSPISIDTSSISGTTGYLEFTYTPDSAGTTPVNSTVSVSSPSFASFNLDNTGVGSYQLEPITFGKTFTFTPTFAPTPTSGADEGNFFDLFFLDSGYNAAPTADPTGSNAALMIVQYADGSVGATQVYAPFAEVNPVPEASTVTTFTLLAVCGLFLFRRNFNA